MSSPYPPDPNQQPYQPSEVPYPPQQYPQQGGYPPPGYPAPAPPAPKKGMGTGKLLLIIGASLVGLCCVGGIVVAAVSPKKTATHSSTDAAPAPAAAATTGAGEAAKTEAAKTEAAKPAGAKVGQPVRDGKFEFVVQKVACGIAKVGDEFLSKTAQGQYCLVTVAVKNIGTQPKTFDGGNQRAHGTGGVKYEHDGTAEIYANKDAATFLNTINPGNAVTGTLVFDIPKDGKLASLELHDSTFSGGVAVDVA